MSENNVEKTNDNKTRDTCDTYNNKNSHKTNTVAALCIAPSGVGEELSEYVADCVKVIRDSGLKNETNAMFTNIEGEFDDVMRVVKDATMVLVEKGYRTGVILKLDIRPGFSGQIDAKAALVDKILEERENK
ncbi:MTH1187 family thiamine-binding protein [Gardnerella pickettii]|uniref:MTH1187 family thiamine-binding protein n=1 Tax=Gardnerella pickettii TaxID=2914924 RepID=UPI0031FD256A|nr:MTH1187 family thiamine-binding protein [Bifidobacterium sp. UMB1230]MDK7784695.1 MTH1187 family thiamine-binding protein [Bifidobacterium sp. UMB6791B]MDK8248370.1 MTH1187 family thiamine-binding protein [Bifidobacterium sp. UMB6794B]MDK8635510.1 MTH1187 family thiamine-binding protein [Bifidobacterium sp. UMB6791A]